MCEVETVKRVFYIGKRVNANSGCEAALTARVRIGWVKFKEYSRRVLTPGERNDLSEPCKISDAIWE